jgi:hypothetical protein
MVRREKRFSKKEVIHPHFPISHCRHSTLGGNLVLKLDLIELFMGLIIHYLIYKAREGAKFWWMG